MSDDERQTRSTPDLGVYSRAERAGLDPADRIALGVSAVWVVACLAFWIAAPDGASFGGLAGIMALAAVIMPIALIWIGVTAAKSARLMQGEAERLQATMDAMRQMYQAQAQMSATTMGPNVERKLDEIVRGQRQTETTLAQFSSRRPVSVPRPDPAPAPAAPAAVPAPAPAPAASSDPPDQPGLGLEPDFDPNAAPVGNADFIVALNFPETADDTEGFAALRRALADPRAARLVQASQDVLTQFSQDGIYMDDMTPDRARPEIWRRFADGERGRTIAALGGIRDRASLALVAQRMRQDQVFRDTSHHFLRTFDKTFVGFAENASDSEIIKLTNTRTARAFMLLGRVAGLFD